MEIKEVFFSDTKKNKDFRIDGEFHTKLPYKNPNLKYDFIGNCLKECFYGISIDMNELGVGYPIYRMGEINNMLCDTVVNKFANISNDELEKYRLKTGDVLFNRTNSYEFVGRTSIYYDNDGSDRVFASYLVKFVPNEEFLLPEYLTVYLNTKYGVLDIKRRSRPSINQTNVNPEEVKAMEIPLLPISFQKVVKNKIVEGNNKRIQAEKYYQQAESLLLSSLGLQNWTPSNKNVSIKSFSDFVESGRLDAEYYQPKYDEIEQKITSYKGGWDYVANCCCLKTKLYLPTKGSDYKYVELSNIGNQGEINGCLVDKGENLPSRARRLVETNDVMVSYLEGSLKSVAIVPEEYNNSLCSTGFHLVKPKYLNAETLLVLFKLPYIQSMLQKCCNGSIMSSISLDEFSKIKLPLIESSLQNQISDLIQESFKLKSESKQLLEDAKRMVELEIEKGG